jgi:hypothetical protein
VSGYSGYSGVSGYSGHSGVSTSGYSGYSAYSGFSGLVGGGVLWLEKSAAYTANTLEGIIADTAGGAWELKLPLAPSVGDSVSIIDAQGTFATNNLTVDTQGENIQEVAGPLICNINNLNIELVYTGATDGWKVRTFPGYTSGASGYSGPSGYSSPSGYSGYSGAAAAGGDDYDLFTWVVNTPAVGGIPGPRMIQNKTAQRIDSYTTAATNCWFNIEERSTIGSAGTNLVGWDPLANVTGSSITTFSNASLAADNWLFLDIAGFSGAPGQLVVCLAIK